MKITEVFVSKVEQDHLHSDWASCLAGSIDEHQKNLGAKMPTRLYEDFVVLHPQGDDLQHLFNVLWKYGGFCCDVVGVDEKVVDIETGYGRKDAKYKNQIIICIYATNPVW